MVRTTRKAGKGAGDSMSVEGLHSSFEKIDGKIRSLIQKGASTTELEACIRRSWAHHFQRPVSEAAVKGLVTHYRAMYTGAKKTRKNRMKNTRKNRRKNTRKNRRKGWTPHTIN